MIFSDLSGLATTLRTLAMKNRDQKVVSSLFGSIQTFLNVGKPPIKWATRLTTRLRRGALKNIQIIPLTISRERQIYSSLPMCFVPFQKLTMHIPIFPRSNIEPKRIDAWLPSLRITPAKLFTASKTQMMRLNVLGTYWFLSIFTMPTVYEARPNTAIRIYKVTFTVVFYLVLGASGGCGVLTN